MNIIAAFSQLLLNIGDYWSNHEQGALNQPHSAETSFSALPIINYQIDAPTTDYGAPIYHQKLLKHEFSASWGEPIRVRYEPPPNGLNFTNVKLELEVSSFGIQYDRLAHVYLNDIEIWRTSTSEPRGRKSISSFVKDVSSYNALFSEQGELSFELNNLVTERLNGTFEVRLGALYYYAADSWLSPNNWYEHEGRSADRVSKIFDLQVVTDPLSTELVKLPRNTTRAVLEVFASGNGNDEFWYAENSGDSEFTQCGSGSLRHVMVRINGEVAGAISPFYQIYTGGYNPALWSPFVAPNAYDVPSYQIDLTPFLPILWELEDENGAPTIEIVVLDGFDEVVHHEWIISAALLSWQSEGVIGSGIRYPVQEENSTSRVQLPSIEVTHFLQTLNATSELRFQGGDDDMPIRVEWVQRRDLSGIIVGGTVINHVTKGSSLTSYDLRNHSRNYEYNIAMNLEDPGVAISEGYHLHDLVIEPTSSEDILSRTHKVHYNGSWFDNTDPGSTKLFNGTDVFVHYRDPRRHGPETYSQHAISRNGSIVTLNSTEETITRVLTPPMLGDGDSFTFLSLSEEDLRRRRMIRRKWLKHCV